MLCVKREWRTGNVVDLKCGILCHGAQKQRVPTVLMGVEVTSKQGGSGIGKMQTPILRW